MTRQEMLSTLSERLTLKNKSIEESDVLTDLFSDSFALIEAMIELQDALNITLIQDDIEEVKTVGQLLDVCETKVR